MKTQECSVCHKVKSVKEFSVRHDGGHTRLRLQCKKCLNAKTREWYADTKGGALKEKRAFRESDPKKCINCGKSKPLDEFGYHNRAKGQHRNMCRDCVNAWIREYNKSPDGKKVRADWRKRNEKRIKEWQKIYKNDPEKREQRKVYHKQYWLKQYGLTVEDYDKLFEDQNGRCAICKSDSFDKRRKALAVDHDHVTNKIRGLLCRRCNQAIGAFQDNPDLLRKAATYLEK